MLRIWRILLWINQTTLTLCRCQWPRGVGLRPLACWNCGFESRRGHGCLSLVSVVCCQVEVYASGWSLIQRSPTECDVSECDRKASTMSRPWPTRGCCAIGEKKLTVSLGFIQRHSLAEQLFIRVLFPLPLLRSLLQGIHKRLVRFKWWIKGNCTILLCIPCIYFCHHVHNAFYIFCHDTWLMQMAVNSDFSEAVQRSTNISYSVFPNPHPQTV